MPSQIRNVVNSRVSWDYSDLAEHYDARAPYADGLSAWLCSHSDLAPGDPACDMGAGTGALTQVLLALQLEVTAIEPNQAMRERGNARLHNQPMTWVDATAEQSGQPGDHFRLVSFGSSFNVTRKNAALDETVRLLKDDGWLLLLWNHRDLTDPLQARIEDLIKAQIPSYRYGDRREDQGKLLDEHNAFGPVSFVELLQAHDLNKDHFRRAWRSHGTLKRQAGAKFSNICTAIDDLLGSIPGPNLVVPYVTRAYLTQRAR